jgi:hypothetical protein
VPLVLGLKASLHTATHYYTLHITLITTRRAGVALVLGLKAGQISRSRAVGLRRSAVRWPPGTPPLETSMPHPQARIKREVVEYLANRLVREETLWA